jgi:hypothetical protein
LPRCLTEDSFCSRYPSMRYGVISIAWAIAVALAFTSARPQATAQPQPSPQGQVHMRPSVCPQGQSPIAEKLPDGTLGWGCSARWGGGTVGEPRPIGVARSCKQDSDCLGDTRCEGGTCGRTGMLCDADNECKYSEFCDTSKKQSDHFRGACAPRGGHH